MHNPSTELRRIARAARVAAWRIRARAAIEAGAWHLVLALAVAAFALTAKKLFWSLPDRTVVAVLAGAGLSVVLGAAYAALRRVPREAGAVALDAHHGLDGRVAAALAFARLPASQRSPLMDLAVLDACERAGKLVPRRAVPLRWPRDGVAAAGLALGVAAIALFEVRERKPVARAAEIDPVALSADDLDLFRQAARDMADRQPSPEIAAALERFNQLVEDIERRRLDRTEAFRRMEAIKADLLRGRAADAKSIEEQLKLRAEALKKSELSRPAAEALEKNDLPKAEKELRALAKRLREKPGSVSKADVERLRQAMKQAAEAHKERLASLERRREDLRKEVERLREELLKKKQQDGGAPTVEESRLLERKERELERLDRETQRERDAGRQLDRLDREIAQAAEDILRQLADAADDLDRGAEDLNRLAQEQMTDQEREELLRRLEDLREQLRQAGKEGGDRMARLRRFLRRAHGGGSGGERGGKACPPGDPNCKEDEGEGDGAGKGDGEKEEVWIIGPNGEKKLVVITKGSGSGSGSGSKGQGSQPGGQGEKGGGKEWGTGHDPNVAGKEGTDPKMGTQDVQAAGLDTGQGPSRSEVILGAAEKGFKGGPYKKVYKEYRTAAEETLHKDKIPPGAAGHVRRYFDLIRPRD